MNVPEPRATAATVGATLRRVQRAAATGASLLALVGVLGAFTSPRGLPDALHVVVDVATGLAALAMGVELFRPRRGRT
jgi:hypothetical protein